MPLVRARRSLERLRAVASGALSLAAPPLAMPAPLARELFASQLYCRIIDVEAHELRARNEGYYTICSAGHEGNVALGHLTRPTDPALLHYRSGAFFLARARHSGMHDVIGPPPGALELLLSLAASADDPIAGGRHKVFGSVRWGIPPQTSTIASHLPKAVGMAVAIDRAARIRARHDTRGPAPEGVVATEADHACGTQWPACNGGFAAGGGHAEIQVAHRMLAYTVAALALALFVLALRGKGPRLAGSLPLLAVLVQSGFGIAIVLVGGDSRTHEILAGLHVGGAGAVWAALVALAALARPAKRQSSSRALAVPAPVAGATGTLIVQ